MPDRYYVYILTNQNHTVLYTGVTNDLRRRLREHQEQKARFTRRYNAHQLVYVEEHQRPDDAITREKQIKKGSRQKKLDLINALNPEWKDLSDQI